MRSRTNNNNSSNNKNKANYKNKMNKLKFASFFLSEKKDNVNLQSQKDLNFVMLIVLIYKIKFNALIKKVCSLTKISLKNIYKTVLESEINKNKQTVCGIIKI